MLDIRETTESLNPPSSAYFRATREKWFGNKIEALASEAHWQTVERELAKLDGFLQANGQGGNTLLGGDTIIFSDIQLAGVFVWARIVWGEGSEQWKRFSSIHGGKWANFLTQFKQFEQIL